MFVYKNLKFWKRLKRVACFCGALVYVASAKGNMEFPRFSSYKKPVSLEIQNEFYFSNSNYTKLGKYSKLPEKNYFLYHMQDYTLRYSPFEWFSLESSLTTSYGQSQTREITLNGFALSQAKFGFSVLKNNGNFHWIWDFKNGIPLNSQTEGGTVIVGDRAFYVETGLWLIYGIVPRSFYIFSHSSFRYRTYQLSSLTSNQLGFLIRTKYVQLGASADVFLSFPFLDAHTNSPRTRWDKTGRVNGGSYKFLSVNPSSLSFSSWLKWSAHPFSLIIYGKADTYGSHYGKGFTVGGNLSVSFNTKSSHFKDFKKMRRKKYKRKGSRSKYFSEETDPNSELQKEIDQLK